MKLLSSTMINKKGRRKGKRGRGGKRKGKRGTGGGRGGGGGWARFVLQW